MTHALSFMFFSLWITESNIPLVCIQLYNKTFTLWAKKLFLRLSARSWTLGLSCSSINSIFSVPICMQNQYQKFKQWQWHKLSIFMPYNHKTISTVWDEITSHKVLKQHQHLRTSLWVSCLVTNRDRLGFSCLPDESDILPVTAIVWQALHCWWSLTLSRALHQVQCKLLIVWYVSKSTFMVLSLKKPQG